MKQQLDELFQESRAAIQAASALKDLEELRVRIFGRKSKLTSILHGLKDVPPAERPALGEAANVIKQQLAELLDRRAEELKNASLFADTRLKPDPTLPGRPAQLGRIHILSRVEQEIQSIFKSMGFSLAFGPEVETDYYNFEAMNFPANHPARDMHDTFFIQDDEAKILLRTHTSPVQVRTMERLKTPPIRVIMPGRTYRCDDDATHSPMFNQVEGLMVDKNVSFADLKAVLTMFVQAMFGQSLKLRFRPSFFPFTEPSAEVDMSCMKCGGSGCPLCKSSGWIEILGSGMVHPNVLRAGGIDPETYTGFAFGMGIERVAMLKYGIDNMRLFFENDLRFLEQF